MSSFLAIQPHTVHVWLAELSHFTADVSALQALLAPDEIERAMRFHSLLDKDYFIITRGLLRKTVSQYNGVSPCEIVFSYGLHGKPYLQDNPYFIEFNASHSADLAIFAMTTHQPIGVDIEKIKPVFKEKIAKRYFNAEEYAELMSLSDQARIEKFYQLWTRKEAIIKARGEGIFTLPSHLSDSHYSIQDLDAPKGYQAAVAINGPIDKIIYHACS